jgi:hypothetical protein
VSKNSPAGERTSHGEQLEDETHRRPRVGLAWSEHPNAIILLVEGRLEVEKLSAVVLMRGRNQF